jgi:MurNAc alpha-1-phosphate uridylyltransferase
VTASSDLAAVVLAAGLGTRLRPLTELLPKALCPVANVPLVDLAIAHVRTATDDIAVNVHHHRALLEAHLAPQHVHLSIEEPEPLGTAGAIGNLRDWIDGRPTLVHNHDAWHPPVDLVDRFVRGWDGDRIRLLVVRPARPGLEDFGDATFAGVSLLPWAEVKQLDATPSGLWEVSWAEAQADDRLDLVTLDGPWYDTGTPSTYLAANLAANGGRSVVAPDATVDATAVVERSVVWSGAEVRAGEHLVEVIRAPGGVTVGAPQR